MMRRVLQVVALLGCWLSATAGAMERPNILVIWGDDIGFWNLSTNNMGMMGYQTPNIDRIANEGAKFTDYYGQQSCTAGRSAFITGQSPIRTGHQKGRHGESSSNCHLPTPGHGVEHTTHPSPTLKPP